MQEKFNKMHDQLSLIGNWEHFRDFGKLPQKNPEELTKDIFHLTLLLSDTLDILKELESKLQNK